MQNKIALLYLFIVLPSCESNKNVIQGKVTYQDDSTHLEIAAENVTVYLYTSIVEYQDHHDRFDKSVITGPSGYYSMFPLAAGPYYIYSEKLDTNGKVLYSTGSSANLNGNQTKIVDLFLH
ncbi:MAG: hypothetical protein IPO83_09215 [Chitinophagaceae bacterium]|nr:hypothetical protein [Chitinophagaceae bacterium]